jgi:hypothetical protein
MNNIDISEMHNHAQLELSRKIVARSKRMFHYTVMSVNSTIQIWIDSTNVNSNEFKLISSISGYQGQFEDLEPGTLADMIFMDLSARFPNTTIWINIYKQNDPVGFYVEYNSIQN